MILHVTFSDGSNPWVCVAQDRHTIAKHWRRWKKFHPDTAQPVAIAGKPIRSAMCYQIPGQPGYYVRVPRENGANLYHYNALGHALAALDRLGGKTK